MILAYLDDFAAIDKRPVTDNLRDIYLRTICNAKPELSLRQIRKGLETYLEEGTRWPWPAELLDVMKEEV